MAAEVGEAIIKLKFDGSNVTAELAKSEDQMKNTGKRGGDKWGNAWSVAAGSLIASAITKITSTISNHLDAAIKRVDIINNFPKVMQAMGYSAEEANSSFEKLDGTFDGLPTTLDSAVRDTQKLAATMGNLNKGTVNATSLAVGFNKMILAGGQGTEAASNALDQYNKMLAMGKVDMQSWGSINDVASGQLRQLAETMLGAGKDGMDLYDALKKGTVSLDDMNATIVKLTDEGGANFASFDEQARAMTGGIGTSLENLNTRITKAITKVIQRIGPEKIEKAIEDISNSLAGVAEFVIGIIDFLDQNQWIAEFLGTFVITLTAISVAIWAVNAAMMASPITWIVLGIAAVIAGIVLLVTHIQEVGAWFSSTFSWVGDIVNNIANFINEKFGWLFEFIGAGLKIVGDIFGSIFGWIGEFVGSVASTIGSIFANVWNGIKAGVQNVWNFITGIFGALANFFGSIFSNAWNAVKNIFSTGGKIFMGIVDGIANAFRTIVNAIITGINHVVAIPFNAINGFLTKLKEIKIFELKPFDWIGTINVPQIPTLAVGGIATEATLSLIGEAGNEAVLPLDNNTDNWAGTLASILTEQMNEQDGLEGRTINVTMNNNIDNKLDAQEIGRVMIESIRRAA